MKQLLVTIFFLNAILAAGQTTNLNSAGNWDNAGIWSNTVGNTITENVTWSNNIGTVNFPNATTYSTNYTIGDMSMANGNRLNVLAGATLNLGQSGTPKNLTVGNTGRIDVFGTLIIWGNVIMGNTLDLNVYAGGVIIIKGNFTGGNNAELIINGNVTIDGNLTVGNGSTATGTGTVTVGGTCSDGTSSFCGQGPLPIRLLFFNASKSQVNISLSWATASELNFDYFDIEKSNDGLNFKSIATVKGNGTTSDRHDYALEDEKPMIGKNYYRLKSVDFDGYTEYFNVVMVDFDGQRNFSIYPNPADGVAFKAETNFTPAENSFVTIYTSMGAEVGRYQVMSELSDFTMPVKLESGWYYARFFSRDYSAVSRFLVK